MLRLVEGRLRLTRRSQAGGWEGRSPGIDTKLGDADVFSVVTLTVLTEVTLVSLVVRLGRRPPHCGGDGRKLL